MYSIVLKNATVIDGSGSPGRVLDVAIAGDKVANLAEKISTRGEKEIDCAGMVVCPGFIDLQNHSDSYWQIFDNPGLHSLLSQGFTTILLGNCGSSLAPILSPQALLSAQKWHSLKGSNINWQSFGEFADTMSQSRYGCNLASLVGYSTLRRGLIGNQVKHLDQGEILVLKNALHRALDSGAFGLSSGLIYAHETSVSELELAEVLEVVAEKGGLFSLHLRDEGDNILESLSEALEIARSKQLNLKVSHFKIRGKSNWEKLPQALELLETAYHQGTRVNFDVYPYDSVWQPFYTYLPKWAVGGSRQALLRYLQDSAQKNKILNYLNNSGIDFRNMVVASTSNQVNVWGKKVSAIAKNLDMSSEQTVLEIIKTGGQEILVFDANLDLAQVKEITTHPLALVATDGAGFRLESGKQTISGHYAGRLVHPRCFGSAPKFLRQTQDDKSLTLEQAIHKLTGQAATKLGLAGRGILQVDYFADLVVLDPKTLDSSASLQNPYQYSSGISKVFVNGREVYADGKFSQKLSGKFLRKN